VLSEEALLHKRVDITEPDSAGRQIGESLAAERKRRGWSQKAISRRTGIAPTVLSRFERGIRDPHLSVISRYAACLGYTVRYQLIPSDQSVGETSTVVSEKAVTNDLRRG
jgi:transcriptional regulator with XRE-family HTH domain